MPPLWIVMRAMFSCVGGEKERNFYGRDCGTNAVPLVRPFVSVSESMALEVTAKPRL